jgi:hypothetical protein
LAERLLGRIAKQRRTAGFQRMIAPEWLAQMTASAT